VKLPRLLRTTAVQLALRYALVYVVVLSLALSAFFWSTTRYVDSRLETAMEQEIQSLTELFDKEGAEYLKEEVLRRTEAGRQDDRLYLLVAENGDKIAGNLIEWPDDMDIPSDGSIHSIWIEDDNILGDFYDDDAYLPVVASGFPDGTRLLLAGGVEQAEELQELTEFLIEVLGISVLLALLMSIVLGRKILGRMDTISRTASEIVAGDLSQRVPVSGRTDEFDALAVRLNAMLDRIQRLIKGIREVTDNIAHDLRSPLTRLRNRLEVALLEERRPDEYRQTLEAGIEDAESLITTFNSLLGIAQAEAGNHRTQWGPFEVKGLAVDLTDLYRPVAEEKGQTLVLDDGQGAVFTGSRDLLAQAIGNLLENAIKYTSENGTICLKIHQTDNAIELEVSDTGPGIPDEEKEHVLERFARLESARNTPGNGLGLSLVKAVTELHGGVLMLENADPGLRVTMRFPDTPVT